MGGLSGMGTIPREPRGLFNNHRPLPLEKHVQATHRFDTPIELLVTIQDEFRSHFGWQESDDLSSAKNLLSIVEQLGVEQWRRPNVELRQ